METDHIRRVAATAVLVIGQIGSGAGCAKSVGNTIDPAEAYRNFRGRDPKVEALMKKRGFSS